MINLKPCPFCGSEAHIFVDENGITVKCGNLVCGACVKPQKDIIKTYADHANWMWGDSAFNMVIKTWNKRGDDLE